MSVRKGSKIPEEQGRDGRVREALKYIRTISNVLQESDSL